MHKHVRLNTLQKIAQFVRYDLQQATTAAEYTPAQTYSYTKKLLGALDNPEHGLPTIHVGGTSGKGTVSYMIDAILRAHDRRSALIVSPHIYDARERVQSNGQLLPEKLYLEVFNTVLRVARELAKDDTPLNYFGILLAVSALGVAHRVHDYVIVEAGIGGVYDLSNLLADSARVSVITQVGHDSEPHKTTPQIAHDVATVIKTTAPVIALSQSTDVNAVLKQQSDSQRSSIEWIQPSGEYQVDDLHLALKTCMELAKRDGWELNEAVALTAIERLFIPGRFEHRSKHGVPMILDGAHNPQSLSALSTRLSKLKVNTYTVLFAINYKKDAQRALEAIYPITQTLVLTEFNISHGHTSRRANKAGTLMQIAKSIGFKTIIAEPNVQRALAIALSPEQPVLVTGSFYLLSEVDTIM